MKKITILMIFILLINIVGCNESYKKTKEHYKLFLATYNGIDGSILVWVNGKLKNKGKFEYGKGANQPNFMLVSEFEKQNSTIFRIKTIYRDTTFKYRTDTIESLYIWLPESEADRFEINDNNTPRKKGEAGID